MKKLPLYLALFALFASVASAAEPPLQINAGDNIRQVLLHYHKQPIRLKMSSGEEVGGVVAKVGDHVVHISQVAGKEFYDAAVRIDAIQAVLVRVRDR